MKYLILKNTNILGVLIKTDCDLLGKGLTDVLKDVYLAIEIAIPALVVLLCTVDIARAVIAQDEKDMKAAQATAIKRVIIGLVIFFVPIVLDLIFNLIGVANGTCGIGG